MSTNSIVEIYSVGVCSMYTSHINGLGSFLIYYLPSSADQFIVTVAFSFLYPLHTGQSL